MSTRTLASWLALVDRLVEARFAGTLEEHGITRTQWRILTELDPTPSTHQALADALAELPAVDDGASSAEQLEELLESGWVEDLDGSYALSERGRDAHDHIAAAVDALRAEALADIAPDEEAATIAVLERIARNLGGNP